MAKKNGLGRGIDALLLDNDEQNKNEGGVLTVRVAQIEPKPGQPRKSFDSESLAQLAESIGAHGVLQPILVRPLEDGRFQIIAGERRWRAAKLAGLLEMPVIIVESDEKKAAQLALIENIQRENLNPLEEAMAYRSLATEYSMTQEEISQQIGKSRSAIANSTRLLDLPDAVAAMVASGNLSAGHARALLGLKDQNMMRLLAEKAVEYGWSVRTMEDEVRKANRAAEEKSKEPEVTEAPAFRVDYVAELERRMMANLGRRVKIATKGGKKSVTLFFEDNEDLDQLLRRICGNEFVDEM